MSATPLSRRLSARRAAVLAAYGGYAFGACAWIGEGGLRTPAALAVTLAGFAVTLGALSVLFRGTRYWRWGNAPDAQVDEFELATRNAAYRHAYTAVSSLGLLGLLAWRIAGDAGALSDAFFRGPTPDLLFWGWMLLVLTLPAALLAWTTRDEEDAG